MPGKNGGKIVGSGIYIQGVFLIPIVPFLETMLHLDLLMCLVIEENLHIENREDTESCNWCHPAAIHVTHSTASVESLSKITLRNPNPLQN